MTSGFFNFVVMSDVDLRKYCPGNVARSTRKGRSESRMANRDEKLAIRFYYYAVIKQLKFSSTLNKLSDEFDIDETVITNRLKKIYNTVDAVFAQKPTIRSLKKRYPYYSW
jgi:hypothetical protein